MLSTVAASAQPAAQYPLDDKLANEPAPWTAPGKWGKHGNWGRWGEDDKRGMLNYTSTLKNRRNEYEYQGLVRLAE